MKSKVNIHLKVATYKTNLVFQNMWKKFNRVNNTKNVISHM